MNTLLQSLSLTPQPYDTECNRICATVVRWRIIPCAVLGSQFKIITLHVARNATWNIDRGAVDVIDLGSSRRWSGGVITGVPEFIKVGIRNCTPTDGHIVISITCTVGEASVPGVPQLWLRVSSC